MSKSRFNASFYSQINDLKKYISSNPLYLSKSTRDFVFLCGANKKGGGVSDRRNAILKFAEKNIESASFFLAEEIFQILMEEDRKKNLLDIENKISSFSDYIVIVLESNSAFAELGAFAHESLRDKLIVINNIAYKNSESFINYGPIRAIEEVSGSERIIYYKMSNNEFDPIGDVFYQLDEIISKGRGVVKSDQINFSDLNPAHVLNKNSAMFIHDIIYMTGPVSYSEIIDLVKIFFGSGRYDNVRYMLPILSSLGVIAECDGKIFRSAYGQLYFNFDFDVSKFISFFRVYFIKNARGRYFD